MSMTGRFQRVTDTEIDALLAAPEGIVDFLLGDDVLPDLDIEKSWHAIHFFLNGGAWEGCPPLDFLVGGGTEIGTEEVAYGPARAFRSDEVRAIWRALEPVEVSHDAARPRARDDRLPRVTVGFGSGSLGRCALPSALESATVWRLTPGYSLNLSA